MNIVKGRPLIHAELPRKNIFQRSNTMKTLYIGNIPFSSSADDVRKIFEVYGTVHSVTLIVNRKTGKSRGFGFIKMDDADADAALANDNLKNVSGRKFRVGEACEFPTRIKQNMLGA